MLSPDLTVSAEGLIYLKDNPRPECGRPGCTNEAVWRYIWEHPDPNGCPWHICTVCRESSEAARIGAQESILCALCGHRLGRFIRWERL